MGLDDFLRQIPGGLILMTCGSGILLIGMWSFILWRRGQRRAANQGPSIDLNDAPAKPAEAAAPPPDVDAKPRGEAGRSLGASIRNFFFYTDEEKQARRSARPDETETPAPGRASPAPQATALPQPDDGISEIVEVLRVWRDVADGSLLIQIGSTRYRTLEEIRAAGQSRRFVAVLKEMAILAKDAGAEDGRGEAVVSRPARQASSLPAPTPEPRAAAAPPRPAQPAPQQPVAPPVQAEAFPAEPPAAPAPVPPPPAIRVKGETPAPVPPSTPARSSAPESEMEPIGSFFDNVRRAIKDRGKEKPAILSAASIPEQIEAYLQYRLSLTPPFMGRSIHVLEAPGGGVRIEVDGQYYEGVGDIAQDDVREFVRTAIQEWEDRQ